MNATFETARGNLIGQSHALVLAAEGTAKMLRDKATDPWTDPWTARSLADEARRLEASTRAWRTADAAYETTYREARHAH